MRTGKRVLIAIVTLLVVALVAPPALAAPDLAVIGDSLTWPGRVALARSLSRAGFGRVEVDAVVSRRVPASAPRPYSGVGALREMRARGFEPELVVVALGTNDLGFIERRVGNPRRLITEMLDEIGPGRRVLWVDVARARMSRVALAWNRTLDEIAAERPRDLIVYHWSRVALAHASWFKHDRIHMTHEGYAARTAMVALAATALLRGEIPPEAYGRPREAESALAALASARPSPSARERALMLWPRPGSPLGAVVGGCGADRSWFVR